MLCPSCSLPAVRWLGYHRQPTMVGVNKSWFSVCGLLITATGLVPFDHSLFYPWAMVVLVACAPSVECPPGGLRPV